MSILLVILSVWKFIEVSGVDLQNIPREQAGALMLLGLTSLTSILNLCVGCFAVLPKVIRSEYVSIPVTDVSSTSHIAINDPASIASQPKRTPRASVWLMTLAKPERGILFWGTLMLVLSSVSQLAMPPIIGRVVDAVSGREKSSEELLQSILMLLGFFGFGSVFSFFRTWLFALAGQRVVARLRVDVFRALTIQDMAFFDEQRTGDLMSRLSSDTQVIQDAATVNFSMLLRFVVQILGATVALFMLSWRLTLVMLAIIPVVMIGTVAYGKYVRRIRKYYQEQLGLASAVAEEVLGSMRTVRSFSREEAVQKVYERNVHQTYTLGGRLAVASGAFVGVVGFIPQAAIAFVVWYGGTLVIEGSITIGLLTSFLLYT
eukprot:EG_transcript_13641